MQEETTWLQRQRRAAHSGQPSNKRAARDREQPEELRLCHPLLLLAPLVLAAIVLRWAKS